MTFLNIKLVDNFRNWYKMFSVQALLAIGSINGGFALLPESIQSRPITLLGGLSVTDLVVSLTVFTAILGIIGRLVDQFFPSKPVPEVVVAPPV